MRKNITPRRTWEIGVIFVLILLVMVMVLQVYSFFALQRTPKITNFPETVYPETIKVVMNYDYEPYSFKDKNGKPSGYDVELAYALGEELQSNVDIQFMNWNDARMAVIEGKADVLMGIEYNAEEQKVFELSIPLSEDNFVAFGKEGISSISELYGAKFALMRDSFCYDSVMVPYKLEHKVKIYPTYEAAFESVINGDNDYVIARYSVGQRMRPELGKKKIKPSEMALMNVHITLGVTKGNTVLRDRIDGAITELAKEGTLEELENKWLGDYVNLISFKDFFMAKMSNFKMVFLTIAVIMTVLILMLNRMILSTVRKQKKNISKELEHEKLFAEATKALYENIYEVDVTRNCAGNKRTERYFKSMTSCEDSPYDKAVMAIAKAQIKREYVQKYLDIFLPENIIAAYKKGVDSLRYDFMISDDGISYHWMRIEGRLFSWERDGSLRMIVYRKNIDNERKHELMLLERVKRDLMTGLYNKATTEELIGEITASTDSKSNNDAFLIIDIDNFKYANDNLGHAFGDYLIKEFAMYLKLQFRENDIVGRIGGDEFAVYMTNIPNEEWLCQKVEDIIEGLSQNSELEVKGYKVTASIGISLFPEAGSSFEKLYKSADQALYHSKKKGKNGYTIFGREYM